MKTRYVALTGRNRTGPLCNVGRPTAHAPGPTAADRQRARRPARPLAGSVTDDDKRHTTATDDHRRHQAKQYWPIRRASNKKLPVPEARRVTAVLGFRLFPPQIRLSKIYWKAALIAVLFSGSL